MKLSLEQSIHTIHQLLKSKKIDEAIQLCKQSIKQFPKHSEACVLLTQIYSQQGQYNEANDALKKAVKRTPKNQALHVMQGDMQLQLQAPLKAEKAYQAALRITPQDNTIKTRLAYAFQLQKDKIEKAIELYHSIINSQPNESDAYYNLGTALKRKHDFQGAADAYQKAIALSPNNAELHLTLGNLLAEAGRFSEAADALNLCLDLTPNNSNALYQLSYVSKRLNRAEASLAAAEHLSKISNQSPQALRTLVAAKLMSGQYDSALSDCELGLEQDAKDRRLLCEKIIALSGSGDKLAANALFKLDELLQVTEIDLPSTYPDINTFNQKLINQIEQNNTLDFSGVSHSCTKGNTSNDGVFLAPTGPLKVLSDAIHQAVALYHSTIDTESSHPWMQYLPKLSELSISGWVTKLSNQGYQQSHIHDTAWISGVYYLNLPSNRDNQAGGIEFGRAPFFYPDSNQGKIKVIEPNEGTLVLFPSYFYHRTIPFESQRERITIAFDFRKADLS